MMMRFPSLLLALGCLLSSAVVAWGAEGEFDHGLHDNNFVQSQAASMIRGDPLTVDFVHALLYNGLKIEAHDAVKAVVLRLGGGAHNADRKGAINFTPRFYIMDGRKECHNEDGSVPEHLSEACETHCINYGRYCDPFAFPHWHKWAPHSTWGHYMKVLSDMGRNGASQMRETARRACIWKEYGHHDPTKYFDYHDAMISTGCLQHETEECVDHIIGNVLKVDGRPLQRCLNNGQRFGQLGVTANVDSEILEQELLNAELFVTAESTGDPSLYINGKDREHTNYVPSQVLHLICSSFPEDDKPQLCDFCLDYCEEKEGHGRPARNSDGNGKRTEICMWKLDCDVRSTHATFLGSYMKEKHLSEEAIVASKSDVDDTTDAAEGGDDNNKDSNDKDSSSDSAPSVLGMAIAPPQDPADIAVFVLAAIITAGGLVLAMAALRVWRTKMIIERYIREQKKDVAMANQGEHHQDSEFFPEDSPLDWDLEPALQYSDLLGNGSQRPTGPPTGANFLPRIS